MEEMINSEMIKKLRKQRLWTQDQLASISGISLRTIQRIEKGGNCSLESIKSLASSFEVDAVSLEIKSENDFTVGTGGSGLLYGYSGVAFGTICACYGVTTSVLNGSLSLAESGIYFSCIGAICGLCCAVIGNVSNKFLSVAN